jgi:pimeloyl-ACP methyl ester carboxylesterase
MAYLRLGAGAPLVQLPGLSAHHRAPQGFDRKGQLGAMAPYAAQHEVWSVNRPVGLPAGTTIADLARNYADAIRARFDAPVDVMGISTGGSIALQLAADHPDVVRRLVLVAAAHRLGPGRRVQRDAVALVRAGHPRRAMAGLAAATAARGWSRLLLWIAGWLFEPAMGRHGYDDMLVVADAEDDFDLTNRLGEITCPVLVVGGDRDGFYSPDLFEETAAGVPDGRLVLYPGVGHLGVMRSERLVGDVLDFLGR